MTRLEAERHARRNAEQVARDALLKRNQAETDRDAARAQRDDLLAALVEVSAQLDAAQNTGYLADNPAFSADVTARLRQAREVIARAKGRT